VGGLTPGLIFTPALEPPSRGWMGQPEDSAQVSPGRTVAQAMDRGMLERACNAVAEWLATASQADRTLALEALPVASP